MMEKETALTQNHFKGCLEIVQYRKRRNINTFKMLLILKLSKYIFSEGIQIIFWVIHQYKIANTDNIDLL